MQPNKALFRLAMPAAAAVLATPLIAAPALARQDPTGQAEVGFSVSTNQLNLAKGAAAKPLKFTLKNGPTAPAQNVVVRISAEQLEGAFTVDLPGADKGCTVANAVATCTLKELALNASHVYTIGVRAANGAKAGELGMIRATMNAANAPEKSVWTELQVQEPGIDLAIADIPSMRLAPGASADLPIVVGNTGNVAADAVSLVIRTEDYFETPNPYSNCESEKQTLTCYFEGLAPGDVFQIDPATPLKIKVANTAPGPITLVAGTATVVPTTVDGAERAKRRSGSELRLISLRNARSRQANDLNKYDNTTRFNVTVPKTAADIAAVGTTLTGSLDETKSLSVGMRNDGPTDLLPPGQGRIPSADITLPTGLEIVSGSTDCAPRKGDKVDWTRRGDVDGLSYRCLTQEQIKVHQTYTFTFKVKIAGEAGDAGVIKVDGGEQDGNNANDSAPITLTIGTGGAGGSLPITGAKAGMAASGGLLLVLGGAAMFWMTRRRPIVTVIAD